jgi:hypothetical protein
MKPVKNIEKMETSELLGYVEICRQRCCATEREDRRDFHRSMKRILDELQKRGEITAVEKWRKYLYCKANCIMVIHFPAFSKCECNSFRHDAEAVITKKAETRKIKLEKQEIDTLVEVLKLAEKCPVDHEKRKAIVESLEGVEEIEFRGEEVGALKDILQLAVKCPVDKRATRQLLQKMDAGV